MITDDPGLNSGYGIIGSRLADYLYTRGHQIEYIGWQGKGTTDKPYKIHKPPPKDKWGATIFSDIISRFQPDIVWSTGDIWMSYNIAMYKSADSYHSIWYAPIDSEGMTDVLPHQGIPIPVQTAISRFNTVIGYTEFAKNEVNKIVPNKCNKFIYPGYDDENIYRIPEEQSLKMKETLTGSKDTFLVMYVSRNGQRKNPIGALHGFLEAGIPNSKLYYHCLYQEQMGYDIKKEVERSNASDKVILSSVPIGQGVSREVMNRLFNAADVHILVSAREGFGMTYLEMAAVGTPSIYTDANCVKEFGQHIGLGIKPIVRYPEAITHSVMQIVSPKDVANALKKLYKDKKLRERISESAQAFASEYTWDKVLNRWSDLIENIDVSKNAVFVSPHEKTRETFPHFIKGDKYKVAIASSWNEKCGIARYTKDLATNMEERPVILAPDTSDGDLHGIKAYKCWTRQRDSLQTLYKTIRNLKPTVLHFQNEWSFIHRNLPIYIALWEQLYECGIPIITTFHTMPTNAVDPMARSYCDKVAAVLQTGFGIVHTDEYYDIIKEYEPELAERITVLYHGVEWFNNTGITKNNVMTFVSSGFAHASKGFEYCIKASKLLNEPHKMIIQTSAHPLDPSQQVYLNRLKEMAKDAPNVEIIDTYLKDEEICELYARSHIGVFMYAVMSAQGVSGSATTCVGAGTPVITTNSPSFSAMKQFPTVPFNHQKLAEEMSRIINNPDVYQNLVSTAELYRETYRWEKMAKKHEELYRKLHETGKL